MAPKRAAKIAVSWLASIPLVLALVWFTGFLYWQMRISRAIAELQRGPGKYESELFYANADLLEIGSRGLPRILGELEGALLRGDEDQAFAFSCGLSDLTSGAEEKDGKAAAASGSYERTRKRLSMEEMKELVREYRDNREEVQSWYAPWWKWWEGHARRW
jgi:hypothetical protein